MTNVLIKADVEMSGQLSPLGYSAASSAEGSVVGVVEASSRDRTAGDELGAIFTDSAAEPI